MRSHKRRNIHIRLYRLSRFAKGLRNAAPCMCFALAVNIFCAAGAVNAIESLARCAGGSDKLLGAALALELKAGVCRDNIVPALFPAAFPLFFDSKSVQASPGDSDLPQSPPPTIQGADGTAPTASSEPARATKGEAASQQSFSLTAEGIQFKGVTEGVNAAALLKEALGIKLETRPSILIIHTHATEAYVNESAYPEMGAYRTHDINKGVLRVGEELSLALKEKGYSVIHDRGVYDYPSYTGSYERSLGAIMSYLKKYPGIKLVLDIHRDAAADSNGNPVKASAVIDGKSVSQIMMVVGKGSGGLENPHWKENLKLAVKLQAALNAKYPGLARPIVISADRYNEHATSGSLLIEIGCNGNTLEESVKSARLLADALAIVLGQ